MPWRHVCVQDASAQVSVPGPVARAQHAGLGRGVCRQSGYSEPFPHSSPLCTCQLSCPTHRIPARKRKHEPGLLLCILPSCPPPTPGQKGQEGAGEQEGQGAGSAASGLQQWGLLNAEEPQNQGLPSGATHGRVTCTGLWFLDICCQAHSGRSLSLPPLHLPGSGVGALPGAFIFILKRPLGSSSPSMARQVGDSVSPSVPGQ